VALGACDDLAVRSGVVAFAIERGLELFAHAPLGGPERATRLARDRALAELAARRGTPATAAELVLAYLLAVHPALRPIVGARRPETIASVVRAESLVLEEEELRSLDTRFPVLGTLRRPPSPSRTGAEVVLLMGVPGAGKSRCAERYVARGYERLNRDTLGGTLRGIVRRLDDRLREGAQRVVLDNTYVTRATRNDVVRTAHARGASVRCVFFDTPPHEAQHNIVQRMLDRFGRVLDPQEIATLGKAEPTALPPSALLRMTRDLEPPAADEGFAAIERVPFVRQPHEARRRPAVALALGAFDDATRALVLERLADDVPAEAACVLVAWLPGVDDPARDRARRFAAEIASATGRLVEMAICPHPAGPPLCWCRPPLPGLWVEVAHRHGLALAPPKPGDASGGASIRRGRGSR
ncbi:MAG TPA: aldo/keto reductase, partial [Labilithrix sp.]|nr:aldo/keto reductase [Labilithrix sp.]